MNLPIAITDRWVSVLDIDPERTQILSSSLHKIPWKKNGLESFITSKKLDELFKAELKDFSKKDKEKTLVGQADTADIVFDYKITDVIDAAPFPIILPETYYAEALGQINIEEHNLCANYLHYRVDLPLELRVLMDSKATIFALKHNPGILVDSQYIIICTPGLTDKEKTDYIKKIIPLISEVIPVAGIWDMCFDSELTHIPLIAYLIENEVDVAEYFDENPPESDAKLIIAPGVTGVKIENSDISKDLELKPDSVNTLKIGADKSINMSWKSKNSKFSGEVYGSKTGVKIDNRERKQNV